MFAYKTFIIVGNGITLSEVLVNAILWILIFNERKLVLGPLDVKVKVKVKVKPKKLRNSMILPELLDNLQLC